MKIPRFIGMERYMLRFVDAWLSDDTGESEGDSEKHIRPFECLSRLSME